MQPWTKRCVQTHQLSSSGQLSFGRSKWKYSQRAYRYIYLDAGHIAQNLALASTSIACGSCEIGAFFDDEINSIVGVDGTEESAICLNVVGHPNRPSNE